MGSGFFQIAISGLNAAQLALSTTSHNITNASTPGYTRQETVQTTPIPLFTGAGFMGQGTSVSTIRRDYNQYLTNQILSAQTNASSSDAYLAQIQQIDNLMADPNAGLSPALSAFFNSIQDLTANPASIPARQAVMSGAQALVSRFQSLDQRITEVREGVNSQISAEVGTINGIARQIGELNQRIIVVQSQGGATTQPANDLLDQRDQLIAQLNKDIRVQTFTQTDGAVNVFIGNGQPLVVGGQVSQLSAVQDDADPGKLTLAMQSPYGGTSVINETLLSGGTLGGLINFRTDSLDTIQNALGRVALGVTDAFNAIHSLGQDLTGAAGGNFFTTSGPQVNANALNASPSTVISAQIVNSDYRVSFTGGNYQITRISDNTNLGSFATLPQNVDGVQISLSSGAPVNGDVFLVRPSAAPGSRVTAETDNTGTAVLDSAGSNLQALGTSDYSLNFTNAATNTWTLTRLSDNTSWTASGASPAAALATLQATVQTGFTLSLSGTAPTAGDSFLIQPTRNAARNIALAIQDPGAIAAGMGMRTTALTANTGTGKIDAGAVVDKSYLPLPSAITLTFDSTLNQFTVSGAVPAVGNISYNPTTQTSLKVNFNGLSFTLSGKPANGDAFVLANNLSGVSDSRTIQLLGSLQTANVLAGGNGSATAGASASFQSAYSQIVSLVGNKAREMEVTGQSQQTLADQAQTSRDSASGVNLDEEAANLMRYQQAYQASAKIIDVAGKLFDQIMAIQ